MVGLAINYFTDLISVYRMPGPLRYSGSILCRKREEHLNYYAPLIWKREKTLTVLKP